MLFKIYEISLNKYFFKCFYPMTMDKLQTLKTQLHNIQESHPNLFLIWNTYIQLREKKLQQTIEQVQSILVNIEQRSIRDIPKEAIIFLYYFRRFNIE